MTDTATPTPTPPSPETPKKKKRSIGKIILKLFALLVILFVIGILAIYFMRNNLVRRGVVYGGHYATEQETGLDAADLALSGKLGLTQLQIHNVADKANTYKEPYLLTMKDCAVDVETGSLLTHDVTVNSIKISGLEITVEQNGFKNNLSDLIEILKKNSPATTTDTNKPPESPGKALHVKNIHLDNTKVHLRGLIKMDLDLGEINMDDITNPDGRPAKIADVISKILLRVSLQIVDQIAKNPAIPKEFRDSLKNVNELVSKLQGTLLKGEFAENLKKLDLKNLDIKGLQDTGKQIQDLGKDAGKQLQGLQGLIPGNKPPATATRPK